MRRIATLSAADQLALYHEGIDVFAPETVGDPEKVARIIQVGKARAWHRAEWLRNRVRGIVQ